ncbi:MAG: aminotransferase class I/II-fold pyridoxal phosphate-dependent enzyme [Oscillospiraceae bacterium]|nr:aminotransferase class I/II-fold pyridoxal phosphate-dependent enzyme [Oscillospiraceae bacterium]
MYYAKKSPHGGDAGREETMLDLSANINPLGTPEAVIKAAAGALAHSDRYPDPCCRALVGAISASEEVPAEHILCGNGASELIYAFCAAAGPGTALEFAPTFSEYSSALELNGCRVERHYLTEENAFLPDASFLDHIGRLRPGAVFVCNPNNPTGRLVPRPLLYEIYSLCRSLGIRLFVDECFLDLSDSREGMKKLSGEYPGLFILKAFTKNYGMAGLRLGYCICSDTALLARMAELTPPWNVSAPAQAAGEAALRETEHVAKARELIRSERAYLSSALEARGLSVIPSEANFLLFRGPEKLGGKLLAHGVALRDCSNFPGLSPGWYRTAVRGREENLRFISALEECV